MYNGVDVVGRGFETLQFFVLERLLDDLGHPFPSQDTRHGQKHLGLDVVHTLNKETALLVPLLIFSVK